MVVHSINKIYKFTIIENKSNQEQTIITGLFSKKINTRMEL